MKILLNITVILTLTTFKYTNKKKHKPLIYKQMNCDWNPDKYLLFAKERNQPPIDLANKIEIISPKTIADLGCGPGNSTRILHQKWPSSKITGLDKSPAMIDKASQEIPQIEWKIFDAEKDLFLKKYDLIFSNATFQWIVDQKALLINIKNSLNAGGWMAVQLPLFWDMPLGKAIDEISHDEIWKSKTNGLKNLHVTHSAEFYYDILCDLFHEVQIWQSDYYHVMGSHYSILEMIRSTGLRPFLDALDNNEERNLFEGMVLKRIEDDYPKQKNGTVLFPFKRLFFTAH